MSFEYCDELGPKAILHLHDAGRGLKAILVVDNVACGPAIGGARMAPDVSLEECFRLARAMTYKNAAAGIPHGGGKSVIFGEPAMDPAAKERLIRAFAHAIGPIEDYIVGPDMGTDETAMAWVYDEIGRCSGLPGALGGIPLDEIGATGFGLAICAEEACAHADVALEGARIAIQGFGAVGKHAARFLAARGASVVADADSSGTVHRPEGLDEEALIRFKEGGGHLAEFDGGEHLPRDAVIGLDCDILVPAARPDVVTAGNQATVQARLIVPGANIGVTLEAEDLLHARGVLCLPDFIANAGGVICAAVEYQGGTQAQAFATIEEKIRGNARQVLGDARERGTSPRAAAVAMAEERIREAMRFRRFA